MELFKLLGRIVIDNSEANTEIDETTDKASVASDKISGAFQKIATGVATFFAVDKIKDFGVSIINAASDAQAAASQFTQVFGEFEGQAAASLSKVADQGGISENRLKGSFTQIAAFAKTTGMDTESALGLSERAMLAVADSAAFYDRSIEETTESLQSFLKGNYENDAALGLSATETTRNAAANKLYGKSFNDLSESQKQLTLLQMVEDANKASGALGQAARESDTWTNVTGNLKQAWTDFQAVLGANVLPVAVDFVKSLAEKVTQLSEKIPAAVQWFNQYKGVLAGVAAVVGTVVTAYGLFNAVQAIKSAMNAAEVASLGALVAAKMADVAATAAMLAPYIAIVAVIAAVAAGIIYCYNHFETFRNIVNGVAEFISSTVTAAFEFLRPYIEAIVSAVGELVSAIGERLMQAFTWIVEKITEVYNSSSPIVQAIKTLFVTHFENIRTVISTVFEVIKTIVSTALTVIRQVIQVVTAAINGDWSGVWNGIKAIFSTIWNAIKSIVTTVINAVKTVISNTLNAIKSVVSSVLNSIKSVFSSIWNGIKSTVSSVWNGIKSTISNAINGVKSTISSGLNSAKSTVSNVLNSIKSKFSSIFESAKSIVSNAINKIKGFFNFSWSLPKIKLPHFSISGKFSLNPPSIPKFSVSWYKKAYDNAMLLNNPTIFGYSPASGKFLGGGEGNGSEVIAGSDTLMGMIRTAASEGQAASVYYLQKIIRMLADFFPQFLDALLGMDIVLDDGTIVGKLAPAMDKELGKIKERKGRGR